MSNESIKIIIEAEKLTSALIKFAEAINKQDIKFIASQNDSRDIEVRQNEDKLQGKLAEKDITLEEVRKVLATKSKNGKQAQVKELIQRYGVNKLTDIKECNYKELLELAEVL